MRFDADGAPLGRLYVCRLVAGTVSNRARPHGAGDVFLASPPDRSYRSRVEDAEVEVAVLDPGLLAQVAGPVRFTGNRPVSPQARIWWNNAYDFVRDNLTTGPAADPATDTVGLIAARWGFLNHSRFTARYRAEYGSTPSATLQLG